MPLEVQYVGMMGAILIFVGTILALLPVGECSECAHCRNERLARSGKAVVTGCLCRVRHPEGECPRDVPPDADVPQDAETAPDAEHRD